MTKNDGRRRVSGEAASGSRQGRPGKPALAAIGLSVVAGLCTLLEACAVRPAYARAADPERAGATSHRTLGVTSFGAVGDGVTDDTLAVQRALDALRPGDTLVFPAGKVFRHTDVLTVRTPGVRISGPGTLLATNEGRSSVRINADNVTVDGSLTLKIASTTRRWDAYEQMKLRLSDHTGIVVRHVTVDGSAAAGVYIAGCSHYLLEDVTVKNTRADGIHNTGGDHDGVIRRAVIRNVGDDGVAVVSYSRDKGAVPCRRIVVESPRFYGNVWGRAFSVVGGEDITYRNIYAESSNAAAVYIATEGDPWYTFASKRVRVLGGEIKNSNTSPTTDHGAVLVYSGRPGYANEDIEIADLKVTDTRATASRQVGILGDARRIELRNLTIVGGPSNLFSTNAPADAYNTVGWTFRAAPSAGRSERARPIQPKPIQPKPVAQADHVGFRPPGF